MVEKGVYSWREGWILRGFHNIIVVENEGIFWERAVDLGGSYIVVENGGGGYILGRIQDLPGYNLESNPGYILGDPRI